MKHLIALGDITIPVEAKNRPEAEDMVSRALRDVVKSYALENGNNTCKHCGRACGGRRVCDICA